MTTPEHLDPETSEPALWVWDDEYGWGAGPPEAVECRWARIETLEVRDGLL